VAARSRAITSILKLPYYQEAMMGANRHDLAQNADTCAKVRGAADK
jgi:hypothetical protein